MNKKGFGLLGMLIAVVIIGILMSMVLKLHTGQMQRMMTGPLAPQQAGSSAAGSGQKAAVKNGGSAAKRAQTAAPECKGRKVGNVCVPTEIRSSSLDAFDNM